MSEEIQGMGADVWLTYQVEHALRAGLSPDEIRDAVNATIDAVAYDYGFCEEEA